jgi:hypothetical protein
MKQTRQRSLHFLPTCNGTMRNARRGVSLHGHTQHSRESLGFINRHIDAVPVVAQIARHALARYRRDHREDLDFNRAYWTCPVTPCEAQNLETSQIEEALNLEGLVSLTDHDTIDGVMELQNGEGRDGVVSLEWTLPYEPAYFHLGIHNLPPSRARQLTAALQGYTASPDKRRLPELLDDLDRIPEVLLVLNHPFWEMEPIGRAAVRRMVDSFIEDYGVYIHALEVSGLRPWGENEQVLQMAESLGIAVVSGGDRHGLEASTMLNLTRARTFSEFVAEVREDGVSEIVVMPEYQEPFGLRMMQVAWDVLREYPQHAFGRSHWTDRVFFEWFDGEVRPLSRCFQDGEPRELKLITGIMRQLEKQPWRTALRAAWSLHGTHATLPQGGRILQPGRRPVLTNSEESAA